MTRDLREIRELGNFTKEKANASTESSASSVYTMAAVAGCLLLCVGIIIYALIGG